MFIRFCKYTCTFKWLCIYFTKKITFKFVLQTNWSKLLHQHCNWICFWFCLLVGMQSLGLCSALMSRNGSFICHTCYDTRFSRLSSSSSSSSKYNTHSCSIKAVVNRRKTRFNRIRRYSTVLLLMMLSVVMTFCKHPRTCWQICVSLQLCLLTHYFS